MHHPTDRITHTTAFVTPVVEHWLEREIQSKGVRCSSVIRAFAHGVMGRRSILHGGPIKLFLVQASAPVPVGQSACSFTRRISDTFPYLECSFICLPVQLT